MMRYNRIVFTMASAFTLVSCVELTTVREPVAVGISVSAVELNLVPGDEEVLVARLIGELGQTVSGLPDWTSSDQAIASIDMKNGVVKAIDIGTATMTASFGDFRATSIVTVRPPNPPNTLFISLAPVAIIAGGTDSLAATAFDTKGRPTATTVKWSSSDPTRATIGADGILVGIAPGSTLISATTTGSLSATVTVSVIALTNSLSFTRWNPLGENLYSTDVMSFSAVDRLTQPIERNTQFASIAAPAWSTDGSAMVLEVIHAFFYEPHHRMEDYNSDLYILDARSTVGSPWRALTTNGLSKSPGWSPDGKRVAYLLQPGLFTMNNIYVIDVDAGVPVRVTRRDGWYATPSWSPDGKRLVFAEYVDLGNYLLNNWEIFIVNADGSGLTNASNDPAADYNPSWSPDGRKIAFASWRGTTSSDPRGAVHVMDVDGPNWTRLTSGQDYLAEVAWSPDGQQIAFSAGGSLYVMNADGSQRARLTRPPAPLWDTGPSWRR